MARVFLFVRAGLLVLLLFVGSAGKLQAAGSLSVTGGAPGSFSATLTGKQQIAYTTLGPYQSADTRSLNQGWNITFQASQFTCVPGTGSCPAGGNSLPLMSLLMAPPTVACASGTLCIGLSAPPTIILPGNTAIDVGGPAVKVAAAAPLTGAGTYDFTPGSVDGTAGHQLRLAVPSWAYATTYQSTVTISIVSGP